MADSPSHQLGEFIGDFLERTIINTLMPIVNQLGYYLDYRHERPARHMRKEVILVDANENEHKLDMVVEENGSEEVLGIPKAFIEVAWRRYTKHSKNKVQEISAAITPLVLRYRQHMPFYAAILAGDFTDNSLQQLRSEGFYVLYFPYDDLCALFDSVGISIRWNEDTSDEELAHIYNRLSALQQPAIVTLQNTFARSHIHLITGLTNTLSARLQRRISVVSILPLHGTIHQNAGIHEAIDFVANYQENQIMPINKYEIWIRYTTGETFSYCCNNKNDAICFLRTYL